MVGNFVISFGLVMDIVGAILIYRFAIISGGDVDYGGLPLDAIVEPDENDEEDVANMDRMKKRKLWSKRGVILLGSGFLLQIIGTWMPA